MKLIENFRKRELLAVISQRHGYDLHATYNYGSVVIDEVFCSSTLVVQAAEYLEHGTTLPDHQPIWVGINNDTVHVAGTKSKL